MEVESGVEKGEKGNASEGQTSEAVPCTAEDPPYPGRGTVDDPFIVDWIGDNDLENPRCWSRTRKYILTYQLAFGTLYLHATESVSVLGLSFYVLGFGLGPLVFAPLSEMYGRRIVFLCTFAPFALCHLGGALGHNMATILSTRLLAGIFGSSPLTNAGGAVGDLWAPAERALPQSLYSSAPFLGPIFGPIVGGYVAQSHRLGWRFTFWIMFMYAAIMFILGFFNMSETYAPFLLRQRALKLHAKAEGQVHYVSKLDKDQPKRTLAHVMKVNLQRPFVFLFTEPIVTLLSVYVAIMYSILYAYFAGFPIVFQQERHFSAGEGGLAFLGIGLGNIIGTFLTPFQNYFYRRAMKRSPDGKAPPEARLIMGCVAAVLMPIGMFWFAWTTFPSVPYMIPIVAGIPFGTGMTLMFISVVGYLLDTYTIFAASAIAGSVVLRSVLACAFPIFTRPLFRALGSQWAITLFGFLSLVCAPLPFIFYRFGPRIRARSRYATALMTERKPTEMKPGP